MNAKAFMLLLALAALAATGAYFLAFQPAATAPRSKNTAAGGAATDARLAPILTERADDIARVTITTASASGDADAVDLTRDGDEWRLASKANFPAEPDRVRQLITTLSELRTAEPKTANPDLHNRLAVQWPDSTERDPDDFSPRPTLVSITDADGEPITEIVLGDTTYAGGGPRQYARLLNDNQSWLLSASVTIPRGPLGFANTRFVELPRDSVQSVTITHVGGETLELTRDDPEADFNVANLPEGATMKNQALANNTGNSLAFVNFTDVAELEVDPGKYMNEWNQAPAEGPGVLIEELGALAFAYFTTFDNQEYAFFIDANDDDKETGSGWVTANASGEGTENFLEKFGHRRVKLNAGTIESLTRKPSELIETPAIDDTDPSPDDTPGLPPPTDG